MSLEKYPRTGVYRENKGELTAAAERKLKDFQEKFTLNVHDMFGLSESQIEDLTSDEKADILLFAKHVLPRLAASTIASEAHQEQLKNSDVAEVVRRQVGDGGSTGHDLLHAAVASARSNGKSFRPAYDRVANENAKISNPEAIGEEMTVSLFAHHPNLFMDYCFSGGDPCVWGVERAGWRDPETAQYFSEIAPLRETDPIEYFALLHEEEWNHIAARLDDNKPDCSYMRIHRDPTYFQLIADTYSSYQKEIFDRKTGVHEFQTMAGPLLTRLRKGEIVTEENY